jgi:2-polyprenyl-6-methoxyphenol hydroxylase-like FAD-dependent oxidoreductase
MLEKHPDDMERALTRWEEKLRPFIEDMQRDSLKARQLFTPANEAQRVFRAVSIRLMSNRLTGPIVKKVMRDKDFKAKMIDIVAQ